MRTATAFIFLSAASVLAICAAQTPAPPIEAGSAPSGVTGTPGAPEVLVAPPGVAFAPPRAAFKKPPPASAAPSAAPSSAPRTAAIGSEVEEVTVSAHRSVPLRERARFYIQEHNTSFDDMAEYNMLYQTMMECADEKVAVTKRLPKCDMAVWKGTHGATMEATELAKVYVSRAVALQQNGDFRSAIKDFSAATKLDRTSPRPWIGLGNLYAAKGDFSHALENYDRAMDIAPDDPVVSDNRGTMLESLGRHDEAISDFGRAIALDPRDTSAYANRATTYLAIKRPNLAIADLNEVIRAAPSNVMTYYDRGTAYELNGEVDKAETDYREVVRRMPSFAPAVAALGRLDSKHNPDLALMELGTAIRLDPKSPALRTRAILYLAIEQPRQALADLERVIANDGSDDIAWANRGVAKSKLGDFEGAVYDCTRAIELAPTAVNRVNRGNAYATLQRNDEAIADFDIVLQKEPRNVPALLGRAKANYATKRLTASLDDYTRVIEVDPHSAMAHFNRGNIHLDLKEFGAAFSDYSESLKLDPNQPVALVNRSIAAARLGRRIEAAMDQRRALTLDPSILDSAPKAHK